MRVLTIEEFNLLQYVADKAKMDWFLLKHDDEVDMDYVVDLENGEILSLLDGVGQMIDGLVDLSYLTDEQNKLLNRVVSKLNKTKEF